MLKTYLRNFECFKGVSRLFQKWFSSVSKVFHECFMNVSMLFVCMQVIAATRAYVGLVQSGNGFEKAKKNVRLEFDIPMTLL